VRVARSFFLAVFLSGCASASDPPLAAPATVCPLGGCAWAAQSAGDAPEGSSAACQLSRCRIDALALWSSGGDVGRVVSLLSRGCELGDAEACHYAGRIVLKKDTARGERFLEKACDADFALSCAILSKHFEADDAERSRRFELAGECLKGQGNSCFYMGLYFDSGTNGFPRSQEKSAAAYTRGCDAGDLASCNNLANAAFYGDGVPRDLARAAVLYKRACDGGEALGCANLGYIHEVGQGAARDLTRAAELYQHGCTGGSTYGCLHLAMLDEYKKGAPRDPSQAAAHWKRACDKGDARSCSYLAIMHEDGNGVPRDGALANDIFQKSCKAGEQRACSWLREHGVTP
jgi:hypothetical protein